MCRRTGSDDSKAAEPQQAKKSEDITHGPKLELPSEAQELGSQERRLSLPERALKSRMKTRSAMPTWAAWLPKRLQQQEIQPSVDPGTPTTASSSCGDTSMCMPAESACAAQDSSYAEEEYVPYQQTAWVTMDGVTFNPVVLQGWPQEGDACMYDSVQCYDEQWTEYDQMACVDYASEPYFSLGDLSGHVWKFSKDAKGCRRIQQAFEDASTDEERMALTTELVGHVWDAIKCAHANHVLQKCIATIRPQAAQFVIEELTQRGPVGAPQAARHRYGCRIIQRVLEHCASEQVQAMVEDLLADAVSLSAHAFGNYVMAHIVEHCDADTVLRLTSILEEHFPKMAADGYAGGVLGAALAKATNTGRQSLAHALCKDPQHLTIMACSRWGHAAVKQALLLADPPIRRTACAELSRRSDRLRSSRYGRLVGTFVATTWSN